MGRGRSDALKVCPVHRISGDHSVVIAVEFSNDGISYAEDGIRERTLALEAVALAKDVVWCGVVDIELLGSLGREDVETGIAVRMLVAKDLMPDVVAFGSNLDHPMRRSHQEIHGLGTVVGCVDRGDRSDLVTVTVVIEISGFKTALGMREDVYLRGSLQ